MANALADSYVDQLLQATVDLDDSIKLVGVDEADDTPDPTSDDFLDDVAAGARVGASGAFASKTFGTVGAGVFDAADITVSAVSGDPFESFWIYNDTPGTEATKDLIANFDTATGLPLTPNGGDITYAWNASGIFKLGTS